MDWQGKKLVEQILLLVFAVISFVVGYWLGSVQMMMIVYAVGVVLTALITVPNWPFFNHHPLNWFSEGEKHPKAQVAVRLKKKGTKK
ncbi:probable signal peptidase complex subunit 1 [Hibiscus syriacus]|uniref:probable signal peptidase complex subunit 1 n=1 Tax=Hibiscus syriacus TaxID=106335 RepID=UPI001922933D|nr:probable signal peptidase complex subunit 1 [Hibiscus syriacus]